jgi:hypothetical protein
MTGHVGQNGAVLKGQGHVEFAWVTKGGRQTYSEITMYKEHAYT